MSVNANPASGARLRQMRYEAGISQQRLAELARCSISSVRLLESGYEPESSAVLDRLTAALASCPTKSEAPAGSAEASQRSAGLGRDGQV